MSDDEEEKRFQQFIDDRNKEYDKKHPNSVMACGVTKCRVGRSWTEKDYIDLVLAIGQSATLDDFSRATGRSHCGVLGKLRQLGLIHNIPTKGYRDFWRPVLRKRYVHVYIVNGKTIDLTDYYISVGYIDKGKYLLAPDWLKLTELKGK